ncbi:hypothetical protein [Pseudonocardia alni]|uniref:hypothetical protein n=1 Tax=Pseudonocardia alni TaxID=33907 RepID=UPI002797E9D4|nr:hypothetical protein PaSha_00455 [Pseudonocardia alni]
MPFLRARTRADRTAPRVGPPFLPSAPDRREIAEYRRRRYGPASWLGRLISLAVILVVGRVWLHVQAQQIDFGPVRDPAPAVSAPATDLRTEEGLTRLVDDVRRATGSTVVDRVAVYGADRITVQTADPGRPTRTRTYVWDSDDGSGVVTTDRPLARDPAQRTVDLDDLAPGPVAEVVARAPGTVGVPAAETTRLLVADLGSGPAVVVTCIGRDGRIGELEARLDGGGVVVGVSP